MPPRSEPSTAAFVATLALSTGLAVGAVDAAVDLSVRSRVSASPLSTWTCLGITALASALAFLLLWVLATPLRRRIATDAGALGIALAAAVGTLALPIELACFRAVDPTLRSALLGIPAAAVVAIGTYLLARPFSSRSGGRTSVALFAAWVGLSVLAAAGWLALDKTGSFSGTVPSLAGLVALGLLVAGLAALLARARPLASATAGLALAFAAALVLALLHLVPDHAAPPDKGAGVAGRKPRQVILVVVDTLRADYLSCYGSTRAPTPGVDAMAAKSLFFSRPRASAPWTFPSMSSLLTGLAPSVHLGLRPFDALPAPVRTLASRMSEAGYLTAAFVRNPALRPYTHIDRGFDEYHFQREPHPPSALAEVLLRPLLPEVYRAQVGGDVQTRRVLRWIEEHKDRDFLLWVHYFDPHMSYNPPGEFQPEGLPPREIGRDFTDAARVRGGFLNPNAEEREWIRQLYEGEVRATDRALGALFDGIRAAGIEDDALIVFTADHGDELWEHEGFEHGHAMYDEVLGVPLFLKLPGGALTQRVDEFVSNQSVTPTILEIAGVPYDPKELSAPALVRRDPETGALALEVAPRTLVSSGILYFEARTAVVFDGFKYIQFHVSDRQELYDLNADPGERHDLAKARPELVERGQALLREHLDAASVLRLGLGIDSATVQELDEDSARDLRALGYVK